MCRGAWGIHPSNGVHLAYQCHQLMHSYFKAWVLIGHRWHQDRRLQRYYQSMCRGAWGIQTRHSRLCTYCAEHQAGNLCWASGISLHAVLVLLQFCTCMLWWVLVILVFYLAPSHDDLCNSMAGLLTRIPPDMTVTWFFIDPLVCNRLPPSRNYLTFECDSKLASTASSLTWKKR